MSPRTWGWTLTTRENAWFEKMSPRTWGWTVEEAAEDHIVCDVPTHVGVDRIRRSWRSVLMGCPHARGGGPSIPWRWASWRRMSPRTWGWTVLPLSCHLQTPDVPTHVGVDRRQGISSRSYPRCPHARGGGPPYLDPAEIEAAMSPRTWGWTAAVPVRRHDVADVPTHVGVDQGPRLPRTGRQGCPHARGGGPRQLAVDADVLAMSPRTWGWTGLPEDGAGGVADVPTHVGGHVRGGGV